MSSFFAFLHHVAAFALVAALVLFVMVGLLSIYPTLDMLGDYRG